VRLDKPGQNRAAIRGEHFIGRAIDFPNSRNPAIANQHITAHDRVVFAHRHNDAAFDENRIVHQLIAARIMQAARTQNKRLIS
jgi:hypothetical protein